MRPNAPGRDMNDLPETVALLFARMNAVETRMRSFDELERRIRDFDALERRVRDLEQDRAQPVPASIPAAVPIATVASELPSTDQVSSVFLVCGKALLGIAGAYMLRALEESAILPRLIVAALAIVYAIAWLVAASRTKPQARFAAALYAGTSALILAPMLWELTMRFHVLAPGATAAVLGCYVAIAIERAWRNHSPACSVATGAAALTALALFIVTHVMLPFLGLLLAMVAVGEYGAARNRSNGARILIAAVADCAIWIMLYLYRTPPSARLDYPALGTVVIIAAPCLLFLLTAAGVVFRTAILGNRITAFDSLQAVTAFLLAACSPLVLIPNSSPRVVGVICLVFASACNAAAFRVFRGPAQRRNFRVFTAWSATLTVAGAFLTLTQPWAASALALAAVACMLVATHLRCLTVQAYGTLYLAIAAYTSGLLAYAFQSLAGEMPSTVSPATVVVSVSALLAYAVAPEREAEQWRQQVLHLLLAALAVCATASLITHATLGLAALVVTPGVFHVAFLRTLVLCVLALAVAFAGSRWHRLQLRRVAYAALAFVAAKLIFEDMRHGHLGFIAASIFLFALTLIALPRLARSR